MPRVICSDYYSSSSEPESEGSDKEALHLSSESEADEDNPEPDVTNPDLDVTNSMTLCHAGIPIRAYSFPEEDPGLNLYAPFRHHVDYRLAHFFNRAKTSQGNIEQFLQEGILQGLNPAHHVQFRLAYTMYKLVDAATNEPRWQSGMVDYPLLNRVQFHYWNIISAVKYLLRQKAYAGDMV